MNKINLCLAGAAVLAWRIRARKPCRCAGRSTSGATLDDRCNGVHFAWDYFWVTGAGNSSQGFNRASTSSTSAATTSRASRR